MSIRQRRIAQVAGALTLALSLAAVTSMLHPIGGTEVAPGASTVQFTEHVFVPTAVPLPANDEEPAPTF